MTVRIELKLLASCFAVAIVMGTAGAGIAVPGSSASTLEGEANTLENRYFFRIYSRDPIEKRIERLELLVFGGVQSGTNEERIDRLKKTIKDRDNSSSGWAKGKGAEDDKNGGAGTKPEPSAKPNSGSSKPGAGSSQYPILNTLEWRALKKTFAGESIDQRLERIETKLFGASSPAMAYADRVERLKRTLGVGVAQNLPPESNGPLGPMPKARPRSDMFGGTPFGGTPFGGNTPFADPTEPFGGLSSPFFGNMPGMADMFKDLQRQMQQLRNMPSGAWEWDQESGTWMDRSTGKKLKPGPGQGQPEIMPSVPFPITPRMTKPRTTPVIPPYDDPNSI